MNHEEAKRLDDPFYTVTIRMDSRTGGLRVENTAPNLITALGMMTLAKDLLIPVRAPEKPRIQVVPGMPAPVPGHS